MTFKDGAPDRKPGVRIYGAAAALFAAAAFILRVLARQTDWFSDNWARVMNPLWVNTLGRVSGIVPFSLVEVLLYILLIWAAAAGILLIIRLVRGKVSRAAVLRGTFGKAALLLCILFFLFEGGEDVYFFCTPFSEAHNYERGSYTTEELKSVCLLLVSRCNALSGQVSRDQNGIMKNSPGIAERAREAMEKMGTEYPELAGFYPKPKGIALSVLMSYTNMTGIYSAYTSEANYNRDMPAYNKGFVMCHELSHLKGILPENEANFTAYLATRDASDPDLLYSGAMSGWVYCGNELYKRDKSAWQEIASQMNTDSNADLEANTAFWKKYDGKAGKAAEKFNDSYLKQAGQKAGVDSYNQVVDLIISYEISRQ